MNDPPEIGAREQTCVGDSAPAKGWFDGFVFTSKIGQVGGICTHFPGFTGRCPAHWATHLQWSGWQELHLRSLGPKSSALATTLHPEVKWKRVSELHRRAMAYETKQSLALPA